MIMFYLFPAYQKLLFSLAAALMLSACMDNTGFEKSLAGKQIEMQELTEQLQIGDIVFIRATALPFRKIAQDTGSWTNHVGIVTQNANGEWLVSESTFPYSQTIPLPHFIARSEKGRFSVMRLKQPLTQEQLRTFPIAAQKREGILYDTGFDLYSNRQFCSRYVYEVIYETTGIKVGDVTTLAALFKNNPQADMTFWRSWYLGSIPWDRKTITPASMLSSSTLYEVFEGYLKISD